MAHDSAVRLYLGEDAECNFPTGARVGNSAEGSDILLEWWQSSLSGKDDVDESENACPVGSMNGSNCISCSGAPIKHDADVQETFGSGDKRNREEETACSGETGAKKHKPSGDVGKQPDDSGSQLKAAEEKWTDAQWATFRKHLARETAAADATEASLRRSRLRCRSLRPWLYMRHIFSCPPCSADYIHVLAFTFQNLVVDSNVKQETNICLPQSCVHTHD